MIEFTAVLTVILTVLFGVFETSRLLFTYETLAEAARAGARYAAVHGADCAGGVGGCTQDNGATTVQNFASAAGITLTADCSPISICATYTYPTGATTPVPGTLVQIQVNYTFTPAVPLVFTAGIPLIIKTQSMITY